MENDLLFCRFSAFVFSLIIKLSVIFCGKKQLSEESLNVRMVIQMYLT